MTQGKQPGWAPLDAGPPADKTGQPFPPGSGGSPWPAPPPDAAGAPGPQGLAVVALVFAVVSLLVPVLPGIVALVLAAVAARRVRAAPAGAVGGRGLVVVASALSTIGVLAWVGLGALAVTQRQEPAGWHAATAAAAGADPFSEVTVPPTTEPRPTEPATTEPPPTEPRTTESPPLGAKELAWLKALSGVRTKVEKSFEAGGSGYLTRATMVESSNQLAAWSRQLRRMGAPSDRLQSVYTLVRKVIRTYDKGAKCFATAARVVSASGAVVAGTPEDRIATEALDCAGAAEGNGIDLLYEADAKAEELKAEYG